MNPESGVRTWQWVVTAIVVIVLIVIGIMVFGNKSSTPTTPSADQSTTATSSMATPGVNSVLVSDQYPGNVVYISSVQLSQPGWVVIQKDANGTPGAVIGETYVPSGVNPAKITVSSPIVDGATYYAVLYSDNGDQKFDPTTDLPLKDSNGNVIMRVFHGSANADQNVKG